VSNTFPFFRSWWICIISPLLSNPFPGLPPARGPGIPRSFFVQPCSHFFFFESIVPMPPFLMTLYPSLSTPLFPFSSKPGVRQPPHCYSLVQSATFPQILHLSPPFRSLNLAKLFFIFSAFTLSPTFWDRPKIVCSPRFQNTLLPLLRLLFIRAYILFAVGSPTIPFLIFLPLYICFKPFLLSIPLA